MQDNDLGPYFRPPPPPEPKRPGLPDLAVVAVALASALAGGVTGYTMALDDTNATRAATAASAPRITIATPGPTVPGPPLATVTATVSVERKPREKSQPMPSTLTIPGRYAVGKDIARGQWISKLQPDDEAMTGCRWYVLNAKGELMDTNDFLISTAPRGYTGPKLGDGDVVFQFEPGCAPFELVR